LPLLRNIRVMSPTISTSADALARFRLRSFIVCPRDDSANYIRLYLFPLRIVIGKILRVSLEKFSAVLV